MNKQVVANAACVAILDNGSFHQSETKVSHKTVVYVWSWSYDRCVFSGR